jgi:hypothetical protein
LNKKLVVASALILIGIIGLAYAGYWIYSNTIPTTVSTHILTLSSNTVAGIVTRYHNITLTATLKKDNVAVPTVIIDFLKNSTVIGHGTTNASGMCKFTYNVTDDEGTVLGFTARYWVP